MSSGPRWNDGYAFSSPRISTAFPDMLRLLVLVHDGLEKLDDLRRREARFTAFARRLAKQLARAFDLAFAAAIRRQGGHERAEPLAAIDDPVALELFVGALDGDDAD